MWPASHPQRTHVLASALRVQRPELMQVDVWEEKMKSCRIDHEPNSQLSRPPFSMKPPLLCSVKKNAWKSSTSLFFWVELTLDNAISPARPWTGAWGDIIQSHHRPASSSTPEPAAALKAHLWKNTIKWGLLGAAPWGTFVSLPPGERNSPWAAINWHFLHDVVCLMECSEK